MEYREDGGAMLPLRVHTVLISVQHTEDIALEELKHQLKECIVKVQQHVVTAFHCYFSGSDQFQADELGAY